MKKIFFNTLLCAAALMLGISCSKIAETGKIEPQLEDCSVSADVLGTDTKVALSGNTPQWQSGDQILVFGTDGKLIGPAGLFTLETGDGSNSGTFKGTKYFGQTPAYAIYPASVYATGKFTLPTAQDGTVTTAFESYAVMMGAIDGSQHIDFKNVCSIVKLNTGDYGNGEAAIKSVKLSAAASALTGEFTPNWTNNTIAPVADASQEVTATAANAETGYAANTDIYIPIFPVENQAFSLEFTNTYGIPATVIETFEAAVNKIKDLGTAGGMEFVAPPYVEIEMTVSGVKKIYKWYKQNLAISDSGKKAWKGGNSFAVKVPGTNEDVIVGDFFQWAASYAGYKITDESQKKPANLLLYTSFDNTKCGDANDKFYTDGGNFSKSFNKTNAPYGGTSYTKYTSGNLEKGDDVANIILGDDWRMPTSAEFQALYNVTYWAWDGTDCGFYVFQPGQGTQGSAGSDGTINATTDDKSKALLFFPAAGVGSDKLLYSAGSCGFYWSSTYSSIPSGFANYLACFGDDMVNPQSFDSRFKGFTVRPVSDK